MSYKIIIGAKLGFHDIEIIDNQYGAPIVTKSPYNGNAHASVSHTAALVINWRNSKDKRHGFNTVIPQFQRFV